MRMRSLARLRSLFQMAAVASLASACGGGVASDGTSTNAPNNPSGPDNPSNPNNPNTPNTPTSSGNPGTPPIDRTGFSQLCVGTSYEPIAGLTGGTPRVDYLEYRTQFQPNQKFDPPPTTGP